MYVVEPLFLSHPYIERGWGMHRAPPHSSGSQSRQSVAVKKVRVEPETKRRRYLESELLDQRPDEYTRAKSSSDEDLLDVVVWRHEQKEEETADSQQPEERPPQEEEEDPSLNQFERKYEIGKVLGEGTYASVYKCWLKRSPNEIRAVKILSKKQIALMEIEPYIQRELSIVKKCHHKNVCRCYDIIETEKHFYIVNELLEGKSLDDHFGYMEEEELQEISFQILTALNYLHNDLGLFHGDLHLSNMMRSKDNHITLIDFGLSNYIATSDNLHSKLIGNIHFASPEMGSAYRGDEIDIWSMGVCLFKLLSGIRPFKDRKQSRAIQFQTPLEEEEISEEGIDFFHCIFKPAGQRWNCQQLLAHPWLKKYHR